MSTSLAQKLQLKTGQRLSMLNVPPGYADRLAQELLEIDASTRGSGTADAILLFVNSLAEAQRLAPMAIGLLKADGLLWIAASRPFRLARPRQWARSVWATWSLHHETIRRWAAR